MRVFVKAKPGAKAARIEETTDLFGKKNERHFVVAVQEPATGGRANRAIEKILAAYFDVAPSRVRIVSGETARNKVVEIIGG